MAILESIKSWWNSSEAGHQAATAVGLDTMVSTKEAARVAYDWLRENEPQLAEAFTQADIELALDDRGWLVGGKRMMGELDPLSRQVQVNRSRYYWLRDPLVRHAVRLWTDYAFGATAMTWEAKDKTKHKKITTFMRDRRNRTYTSRQGQKMLSHRLLVDGELFLAFYDDGTMRKFDPLQITDIITDPDDEDVVVAYKRVTAGKFGEAPKTLFYKPWDYPEDSPPPMASGEVQPYYGGVATKVEGIKWEEGCVVYHLPLDPFERRGNTLISATSDWSREHRRFMTARVALAQALSRFAWQMTVKGNQKQVDSMRAKFESTFAQTGLSGGTEHQPPQAPGSTWISNEGVGLKAAPRMTGASDAKTDADNLKLQVCAGTGIMLHYFGDPSTGNLATAEAMELPMLKMFGSYQELWKDAWRDIFSIILQEAPDDDPADVIVNLPDILQADLRKLGTFITPLFSDFPEAKTPRVLRHLLAVTGIEDLDDVMDEIEKNKQEQQANIKKGLNPDGSKPAPAPTTASLVDDQRKQVDDQKQSEDIKALGDHIQKLVEILK